MICFFTEEEHAHLFLLQQAAQGPLPPDSSSPKQHKDDQWHDDGDQEPADHTHRQRGVCGSTVRTSGMKCVIMVVHYRHIKL